MSFPLTNADGKGGFPSRIREQDMKALIIVDMLNDFYTGVLQNEVHASKIVPVIEKLIDHARNDPNWMVVYSNDAHRADDAEIAVWGPHAMAGTRGADVIDALAPIGALREIVSPKRFYGAFDETGLDEILKQYGVTDVVIVGQHTHCCVRHSAYGAFIRGYGIEIPTDGVCVFDGVDNEAAIDYLRTIYGATITHSATLIGETARQAA
jgi:nicotinamidase-related amidase